MTTLARRNPQAPSKAAILLYLEKKKQEEEKAKEKRFQEMLNPYKKFGKKTEPDEDFLKAQKKKEKIMKKKEEQERKIRDQLEKERTAKQNAELERLRKEQEEYRAMEERKRQEKIRKQAIFGKPVDKKMQEYLERIKMAREAEKDKISAAERKRMEERKRQEERLQTSARARDKTSIDRKEEKERERRILENMRRQQNKSISSDSNKKDSKVNGSNGTLSKKAADEYQPAKKTKTSSNTTSSSISSSTHPSSSNPFSPSLNKTRIPKVRSRDSEYSPTRPSIIDQPSSSNYRGNENRLSKRPVPGYSPTRVSSTTKDHVERSQSGINRAMSSQQYIPSPKSKTIPKVDSNGRENGPKMKSKPSERRLSDGGDALFSVDQPIRTSAKPSTSANRKPPRDAPVKNGRDPYAERAMLLKERELELEREKAKNRELQERLERLERLERENRERERAKEVDAEQARQRELARRQAQAKKRPMPSNRLLPPIGLNYRRSNYQPMSYDESEEEVDDEMADFIDDGDDLEAQKSDVSQYIREIFGYDKRKYALMDDDDDIEETPFGEQMKEEMYSTKAGLLEDLEDIRKEEEEKKRKAKMKKRRQMIDDSDED